MRTTTGVLRGAEPVNLLMDEGRFTDGNSVEVQMNDGTMRNLGAGKIFINFGPGPRRPDLLGLDGLHGLNSTTNMELDELPEHLRVLGGVPCSVWRAAR